MEQCYSVIHLLAAYQSHATYIRFISLGILFICVFSIKQMQIFPQMQNIHLFSWYVSLKMHYGAYTPRHLSQMNSKYIKNYNFAMHSFFFFLTTPPPEFTLIIVNLEITVQCI